MAKKKKVNSGLRFALSDIEASELAQFLQAAPQPRFVALGARLAEKIEAVAAGRLQAAQVQDDWGEVIQGTGYMCTACAMPAPGPAGALSNCCGYPVVDVLD